MYREILCTLHAASPSAMVHNYSTISKPRKLTLILFIFPHLYKHLCVYVYVQLHVITATSKYLTVASQDHKALSF